jgi:CDP-diacylglycerol---serine O-phosphatidyltransferase
MSDRLSPRRYVVALPNGFTLANLFFGVFAIIAASRGDHSKAAWYIVIGGVCDALDGRIARATNSGSQFGEELDSLVDAISFGLAPALMMYFAVLRHEGWDWVLVFLFVACAVMRLARFNVEQAGRTKTDFIGLPSPMAGGTLATYYWFSTTGLYNDSFLAELPWQTLLKFLMAGLAFLMISNVPYPAWPRFSLRNWRGIVGLSGFLIVLVGLIFLPKEFFFPVGVAYVMFGLVRAMVYGLLDRGDDDDGSAPSDPAPPPPDDDLCGRRRRRRPTTPPGRPGPEPRPT